MGHVRQRAAPKWGVYAVRSEAKARDWIEEAKTQDWIQEKTSMAAAWDPVVRVEAQALHARGRLFDGDSKEGTFPGTSTLEQVSVPTTSRSACLGVPPGFSTIASRSQRAMMTSSEKKSGEPSETPPGRNIRCNHCGPLQAPRPRDCTLFRDGCTR